ncbi:ABC transporter permease [Micromonospora sp. LOL_015]|uniref:ABC transporter permease n=1 Tax=Micromonospora sp. LOL_015 TaxID=3345416 RepID=UPI003A8C2FA2
MVSSADRQAGTRLRDIVAQAWWAVAGRRTRSMLTSVGVGLGTAATLATLGVTASAAGAISDRFDAQVATRVTVQYPSRIAPPPAHAVVPVRRLNGAKQAGLICQSFRNDHSVSTVASQYGSQVVRLNIVAAQPAALAALGAVVETGRMFDEGHAVRQDPVVLLDTVAAADLGLHDPLGKSIYVNGQQVMVLGVYRAPRGDSRLTAAVAEPYEVCRDSTRWKPNGEAMFQPPDVVIRTDLGAAHQVADEAKLALQPAEPDALTALVPPDLQTFRQGVERDTASLFLSLAVVSLVIGALGVSNTTLVSVLERQAEIGLRRAIGASRRAVAAQFLVESSILGLAGGLIGTLVAVNVTTAVALAKGWLVVLDPILLLAGPLLGLLVGTAAGGYPAWSTSRVSPAVSLRR